MRKFIIIAAIFASTSAFGQAGYRQQEEMFFQNQQNYHQQQVYQAQQQQQMDEQMRQLRAIQNTYSNPYGYR